MPDTSQFQKASPSSSSSNLVVWFRQHEWTLVGLLALLAFGLGMSGYYQDLLIRGKGTQHNLWDVLYNTLRLFILEGHDSSKHWPLYLQVARLLAPLVLFYTAAKAIWLQIRESVALHRLRSQSRDFVVICGLGETGGRLARAYATQTSRQVVVLELDPHNPQVSALKELGAIVLFQNALDPVILRQIRIAYAKEVFACTGSGETNIAIAKEVERLTRRLSKREVAKMARRVERREPIVAGQPPVTQLRCFVRVDESCLHDVFVDHPFFALHNDRYAVKVFRQPELIARTLFEDCAPDLYYRPTSTKQPPVHVALLGFGALGAEITLQVALTAHYQDLRKPVLTVLCSVEDKQALELHLHRYPNLRHIVELHVYFLDPLRLSQKAWMELQQEVPFSVCYVSMRDDVSSLLAARRLHRFQQALELAKLPFVVCLNQQSLLSEILDDNFVPIQRDKRRLLAGNQAIEYMETLDQTITIDRVVNEVMDVLAKTIHDSYLQSQFARGQTRESNPSLIPWEELPPHKKKANQHAASHMDVKLRIADCRRQSEASPVPEVDFPGSPELLDQLAQMEHLRWMADKYLAGYVYGPRRDEHKMHHPDLVDWDVLTESDRDKDRHNIEQISRLLKMQGEKICKR